MTPVDEGSDGGARTPTNAVTVDDGSAITLQLRQPSGHMVLPRGTQTWWITCPHCGAHTEVAMEPVVIVRGGKRPEPSASPESPGSGYASGGDSRSDT